MADSGDSSNKALLYGGGAVVGIFLLWFLFFRGGSTSSVNGKVTLDGQVVPGAQVVFVQQEGKQETLAAQTNEQGEFLLTPNSEKGITPGKYKVAVAKEALKDGSVPQGEQLQQARSKGQLRNILPPIYQDHATSPLEFEVKSGGNVAELQLTKGPPKK